MPARDRRRPFWSKWFWKDWDSKTKDLSPHEYTAYHRLLSYAATCSPDLCSVPDDDRRLSRAIGFGIKRWLSVRSRVLDYFFLRDDLRYEHPRLREDADRWSQVVAIQTSRVNRRLSEVATEGTTEGQPRARRSQKSEARSQKEEEPTHVPLPPVARPRAAPSPVGEHPRFAEWYSAYPRHKARQAASRAYAAAIRGGADPVALLTDSARYKNDCIGMDPSKIKHPATWLNGRCWLDEPDRPILEAVTRQPSAPQKPMFTAEEERPPNEEERAKAAALVAQLTAKLGGPS